MRRQRGALFLIFCLNFAGSQAAWAQAPAKKMEVAANPRLTDFAVNWTSDKKMHEFFTGQFIQSVNFGVGRMIEPTMAINHLMCLIPEDETPVNTAPSAKSTTTPPAQAYGLDELELIGVARHSTPVAFIIRDHRNHAATLATRELTDFEKQSLDEFRGGKDVVVQSSRRGRIAVGALRAQQSCIECHESFKVGDVLGALEYHLSPVGSSDGPSSTRSAKAQELDTVGRLKASRIALGKAFFVIERASPDTHGDLAEQARKSIAKSIADVSAAMTFAEAHPDLDATHLFGSYFLGGTADQVAGYAPAMLADFDPEQTYRGTIRTDANSVLKAVAFGPQDERGIRIDQDGNGISINVLQAIVLLDKAMAQMTVSFGGQPLQEFEDLRLQIVQDIRAARSDAGAALDYVHAHVQGKPVGAGFPGPNVIRE